ncbi:hypothetical protein GPALN_003038 [Globodera pallida]|nr:hypothetical protein GPALN_003038 [Globodera pallida]
MDDAAQDDSRTVTIALDSPSGDQKSDAQEQLIISEEQQNGKVVDFLTICPPPSPSDLLSVWRSNGIEMSAVRVRHLRADMAQLLELRLNPPSCGSMRNWEFVAAHLGLDIEETVQTRRTNSPMCALIHRFGDEPLHKLLELIGEAGRIDVLISVRHFATNPMATECRHRPARMDSALISASDSISSSTAFARSEEGIKVVDVDQCMCDKDLLGSVSRHFDRADQVVMELSPDYADLISAAEGASSLTDQMVVNDQQQIDQRVRMKLYLHQMTFNEVLLNGNQNRRFRVVLMQELDLVQVNLTVLRELMAQMKPTNEGTEAEAPRTTFISSENCIRPAKRCKSAFWSSFRPSPTRKSFLSLFSLLVLCLILHVFSPPPPSQPFPRPDKQSPPFSRRSAAAHSKQRLVAWTAFSRRFFRHCSAARLFSPTGLEKRKRTKSKLADE